MKLVILEGEDGQVSAVFGRGLPETLDVCVVSALLGAHKYELLPMDTPLYVEEIPGATTYGSDITVSLDCDGVDQIAVFQSPRSQPITVEETAAFLRNLGFESVHVTKEDKE